MSYIEQTFIFFMKSPYLQNLFSISVELPFNKQCNNLSLFHRRILKCRELIFLEPEIVATPENFSQNRITIVVSKNRFYSLEFKQKLKKMELKLINVSNASPLILQDCLQYTVIAKLAPQWNVVQNLLVQGRDFLTTTGPLRAVEMNIFVSDDCEISLCLKPKCIKLPPFKIENYVNMRESSRKSFIVDEKYHVLPSLKKGTAISLSKCILNNSVFKNYSNIKKHWKNMYGYRLPEMSEEDIWYVNILFRTPRASPLSYPSFCIRPYGMIQVPRIDPQLTLCCFISDFCKKVDTICNEKCCILDLKASFPLLKLWPATEFSECTASRIGTTYEMIQHKSYRSSSVIRTTPESQPEAKRNELAPRHKLPKTLSNILRNCQNSSMENSLRNSFENNSISNCPIGNSSHCDTYYGNSQIQKQFFIQEGNLSHDLKSKTCLSEAKDNDDSFNRHVISVNNSKLTLSNKDNDYF